MRLKDIQVGQFYAKRFGYNSVRRIRVDELEMNGRSINVIHYSYGRSFEHTANMSSWNASYDLLDQTTGASPFLQVGVKPVNAAPGYTF